MADFGGCTRKIIPVNVIIMLFSAYLSLSHAASAVSHITSSVTLEPSLP